MSLIALNWTPKMIKMVYFMLQASWPFLGGRGDCKICHVGLSSFTWTSFLQIKFFSKQVVRSRSYLILYGAPGYVSGQTQFVDGDQYKNRKVKVPNRKTCMCSLAEAGSQISRKIILISKRPDKTSFRSLKLGNSGWGLTREMYGPFPFAISACLRNQPEHMCSLWLWALLVGFKLNLTA